MRTNMKRLKTILFMLIVAGLSLVACQPQVVEVEKQVVVTQVVKEEVEKIVEVEVEKIVEVEREPLKVAFVYVAPIGDLGWT